MTELERLDPRMVGQVLFQSGYIYVGSNTFQPALRATAQRVRFSKLSEVGRR